MFSFAAPSCSVRQEEWEEFEIVRENGARNVKSRIFLGRRGLKEGGSGISLHCLLHRMKCWGEPITPYEDRLPSTVYGAMKFAVAQAPDKASVCLVSTTQRLFAADNTCADPWSIP